MTNVVKLSKKAFTWSVVVMTVLWSVGAAALIPATVQAAECPTLEAGDLFKVDGSSAVYLVNTDLKRMYFPTGEVYKTWYTDYSGVQTIDSSCTAAYPPAGGVNFRPGSRLFKSPISPVVYAVSPDNTKNPIADEATAKAVYGDNWGSLVRDLADVFILNYKNDGSDVKDSTPHNGQLVKKADSADVYQVVDGMLKKVEGDLSAAAASDVRTLSSDSFAKLEVSDAMASAASVVANPAQMGASDSTTTPVGTGKLSVSLASDNPASTNVIKAIDGVVFTKLAVKNDSSDDVKINSFKIVRKGLGATADFSSVTIYDGAEKVGSTKSSWNSDGYMTYNVSGGFAVKAGETKMLEIHGKLANAGTYNALGIESLSLASGSVSGLPVYGNEMSGVTVSVGTVTMTGQGTTTQTKKIGSTDLTLGSFRLALSSVEDGKFESVTLKQKGTATMTDVKNLYLYKGTDKLAGPVSMNADKEVIFVLDSAYALQKSKSEDFKVIGDIVNGDAKTVEFVLNATTDLVVSGNTYKSSMTVEADHATTGFMVVGANGTTATTIDGAELNIGFSSAALETPDDRTDIEFGRATLSAGSTDVKITSLIFTIDETDGTGGSNDNVVDIDELELVDAKDGSAYSGTMTGGGDTDDDDETWTFSDDIYLEAGVAREFIIRGDLASGSRSEDTYKVTMTVNTTNVVAETVPEGDTVDNFSVGSIDGKVVTVKSAALTVRPVDLNSVNGVGNESGVLLYKGSLEGISGDVHVERLRFEGGSTTSTDVSVVATNFDADNWSEVGIYTVEGTTETLQEKLTSGSLTDGELDFTNLDFDVKEGSANKVTFVVRGTLKASSSFSANTTVHLQLDTVTAKDGDNDTVTASNSAGTAIVTTAELETTTTVTLQSSGVLYVSMRNADTGFNKAQFLLAGDSAWVGKLRIKADYENILLRDLKLTNSTADDEDSVESVCLYSAAEATDANKIACSTLDSNDIVFFDDIDVTVESGTHDWYIYVTTKSMGNLATQTADTHDVVSFMVNTTTGHVVARGIASGDDLAVGTFTGTSNNVTNGKIVYDYDLDGNFGEAADAAGTASTLNHGVVGSKVSDVSLVSSYGGATVDSEITGTGEYTVGIVKVANSANVNKDSSGDDLKLVMDQFIFDFEKNAATTISGVTIQRVGGTVAAKASTMSTGDSDLTKATTTAGTATLDADHASNGLSTDANIDAGQTAYFVVKATVSAVSSGTDWIKMNLDALDGSDSVNNIDWLDGALQSNGSPTTKLTDLYVGKTSIDGTKIAEQN